MDKNQDEIFFVLVKYGFKGNNSPPYVRWGSMWYDLCQNIPYVVLWP